MQSVQFRNGLKRILHHEQQGRPRTAQDNKVTALVHSLCDVEVKLVEKLESQFLLKASGEDITLESGGSDRLVVRSSNSAVLFLAATSPVRSPVDSFSRRLDSTFLHNQTSVWEVVRVRMTVAMQLPRAPMGTLGGCMFVGLC